MEYNKEKLKNKVYLAIIGMPHGIKGDVFVKILGAEPQRFKSYDIFYDDMGRSYEIVTLRIQKNKVIVHFKGVENRNAAEALKGIRLYVMRDQLIDDLGEDEFYQVDLIGLRVQDCKGEVLGEVCSFFNFGAGDLLEIHLKTGKKVLIPFSKAAVPEICIDSGFLVIDSMAAGFNYSRENDKREMV
ncbi:16S rRNA processing protein RimM [Bartonella fuyuanensis]|uniref:Ribosome maturation factor RimM n=1 Tax=Bartonella fuyuanensis TaxID=1460968 RepID=A0A840DS49_9HYPH|nr:ribosome maturation factor RimM [Bartonella fuyuanensis]MBB4075800.1 16S rRNA processing protein RimM [Bartonella fuyuanensis]